MNLSPFSPLAALHNHYMLSSPDTSQIVSFAVFAGHLPFSVCWDPKKVRFWSIPPVQSPGTDQVDKLIRRCKFPVLPNAVPFRLNSQWSRHGLSESGWTEDEDSEDATDTAQCPRGSSLSTIGPADTFRQEQCTRFGVIVKECRSPLVVQYE